MNSTVLVHMIVSPDGAVTRIGWANPDVWKEGQYDPITETTVYKIANEEFLEVDRAHAFYKDGHLIQDPDFVPYVPEPVEAPKELTNEQITQAIAQMTVLIAQRGQA